MKIVSSQFNKLNKIKDVELNKSRYLDKQKHPDNLHIHQENSIKNNTRPARALSFGGSAVLQAQSVAQKAVYNKALNGVVGYVYKNEVAYNAIYSLLVAGVLKPMFVLNMPGSEEKDKQIVATKNFLQAFIGSFLGFTIGGGFIKKAVDIISRNVELIKLNSDETGLKVASIDSAKPLARDILIEDYLKDKKSFKSRLLNAGQEASTKEGLSKVGGYIRGFFKKDIETNYAPSPEAVKEKAQELIATAKEHLPIFERNLEFFKKLKSSESTKSLFLNKDTGLTTMDAYNTLWKNSTGFITSIGKAKISSLLLPTVMAVLFAKRNLEIQQQKVKEKIDKEGLTLLNTSQFKNQRANFEKITSNKSKNIPFKGLDINDAIHGFNKAVKDVSMEKGINSLAKGFENISVSKFGQWMVDTLSKFKKQTARVGDVESGILTLYWVQNTARSKKIDPDQKLGLNVHTVLVTVVSSACAFLIDLCLDGAIKKVGKSYNKELQTMVNNNDLTNAPKLLNGKKFAESITRQNNLEQLAKKLLKSPNATKDSKLELAKEIFKTTTDEDLLKEVESAELLKDIAYKLKALISNNATKDEIDAVFNNNGFKASMFDISQITKEMDLESVIKQLSGAINQDTIKKTSKLYSKQLSKFKSLTIFTLVVRFLVPVLMVPISGKLKKKVVEHSKQKSQKIKNK